MARKWLKRYLPDSEEIAKNKTLKLLGPILFDPLLWHLHRRNVAKAVAIGMFYAFVPLPLQMLLAAVTAIIARANMPVSIALVWVSNPFTLPPILFVVYKTGCWLIGAPIRNYHPTFSFAFIANEIGLVWKQVVVGSLFVGMVAAIVGYFGFRLFWRIWVVVHWRRRAARYSKQK